MKAVLSLEGVGVHQAGRQLLGGVDWQVHPGQHWVVLGPNGAGKTTLARVASLRLHPSVGVVEVTGQRLGRTDVRALRARIGLMSAALTDQLRPTLCALEVVMTARHGALEPWWHSYSEADEQAALRHLDRVGCSALAERAFGTLSSGERQRVLLARALFPDPALLLLDEPAAGLDLGGREQVLAGLDALTTGPGAIPWVLVTHHVEEIPPGATHALVLRAGEVLAAGALSRVMTAEVLSAAFGVGVQLGTSDGRYWARGLPSSGG